MKKIAVILLLIFGLVQLGPSLRVLGNETIALFSPDEEKSVEKETDTKPDKKDFTPAELAASLSSRQSLLAFHHSEKIHPSPCLEKNCPPPNYC